jgi:hypothetical protein
MYNREKGMTCFRMAAKGIAKKEKKGCGKSK